MSVFFTRRGKAGERINYIPWIETTGTQYLDMEISVPHAASRVVIEFAPMEISADNPIAGTTYPSWSWDTNLAFVSASKILVANTYGPVVEKGVFYKFEYTSTYYRINDGNKVSMANRSYRDGYNNTVSFASGKCGKNRIKHYQLYNGDVLVRDCYACIDPEGVACMYDRVQKKYRYNQGSGEFYTEDRLPPQYYWQKHTVAEDPVYTEESTSVSVGANVYYCNNKMAVKRTNGGTLVWDLPNAIARAEYIGGAYTTYRYFYNDEQNSNVLYYATMLYSGSPYTQKEYTLTGVKEVKGSYISDVASTDPNAYPENGVQDGYWYVKVS